MPDRLIKCVVWDLDGTLWPGVQAEGDPVEPRAAVLEVMDRLAARGILHSVASRNDPGVAARLLALPGLAERFVAPQISWGPKDGAIRAISRMLNLGLDSLAFVDDNPFERAAISQLVPEVLVLGPEDVPSLPDRAEFGAGATVTGEASRRARMYAEEERRREAEQSFAGSRLEFLRWCEMRLLVRPAAEEDLPRVNEMVARTNQLNSTGERYPPEQVELRLRGRDQIMPVGLLTDRFGDYGLIGAAFVDAGREERWTVELLMLSCRVEGRGIPAAMLRLILDEAARSGAARLEALYRPTAQNRQMLLLLRTLGFRAPGLAADRDRMVPVVFSRSTAPPLPPYPEWLHMTLQPLRSRA